MTVEMIGREAEALMDWAGLMAAFEAGHRLPKAEINDLFLYRAKDTLLNRAAWIDGLAQLVKVALIMPDNPQRGLSTINGVVNLFDNETGVLTALVDFHLVTKWKTAGDSLLAASRLARKDSRNILLVGAGNVARSMVDAYSTVFPDARFHVWNRSPAGAEAMAEDPRVTVAPDLEAAVKQADIICSATMSKTPVINGAWLQPGQHLDLIGAYNPHMREVDDEAITRARLFVDSRATTIHHIGEIRDPIASGAITEADIIADYYDLAKGSFTRRSSDEITICKNGGGAHLDLMTAAYIQRVWRER